MHKIIASLFIFRIQLPLPLYPISLLILSYSHTHIQKHKCYFIVFPSSNHSHDCVSVNLQSHECPCIAFSRSAQLGYGSDRTFHYSSMWWKLHFYHTSTYSPRRADVEPVTEWKCIMHYYSSSSWLLVGTVHLSSSTQSSRVKQSTAKSIGKVNKVQPSALYLLSYLLCLACSFALPPLIY